MEELLGSSSISTFLLSAAVPAKSLVPTQDYPSYRFTIAFPFVNILFHLEVKVGASQMGPGSEELEDILLLHLQDIETSGHCGVSLGKRRQGTCGHKQAAQPGGDSELPPPHEGRQEPQPPSWPRRPPSSSPPTPDRPWPFPAARLGPARRRGAEGRAETHRPRSRSPRSPPRSPRRRPGLTLTTPCGGRGGKGRDYRVTYIYSLAGQWGAAGRAGLRGAGPAVSAPILRPAAAPAP